MTTIIIDRELLEQALNALTLPCDRWSKQQFLIVKGAIEALNAALAAPATAPATAPAQPALERKPMTDEEVIDLVRECGLDWHKGFMPLFDDDPTNRFAVLVRAVEASHYSEALDALAAPECRPMTLAEIKLNPVISYFGVESGEKIVRAVEAFHDIKETP